MSAKRQLWNAWVLGQKAIDWVAGSGAGTVVREMVMASCWNGVATVGPQVGRMLSTLMLAWVLGPVGLGEYALALSTVAFFSGFAGLGLSNTSSRYVAEWIETSPESLGRLIGSCAVAVLTVSILMTVLLIASSEWVAETWMKAAHLSGLLQLACVILCLQSLDALMLGLLNGLRVFRLIARNATIAAAAGLIGTSIGAIVGGVTGAIWGYVFSSVIGIWLNGTTAYRKLVSRGVTLCVTPSTRELQIMRSFSLPGFITGLIPALVNWVLNLIVVRTPGGFEAVALLTIARQWTHPLTLGQRLLTNVSFPMLCHDASRHKGELYNARVNTLARSILVVTVLPSIALACASPVLGRIYGIHDRLAPWIFILFFAKAVFEAYGSLASIIITSIGSMWWALTIQAIYGIALIVPLVLFADVVTALDAALGTGLATIVRTLLGGSYAWSLVTGLNDNGAVDQTIDEPEAA